MEQSPSPRCKPVRGVRSSFIKCFARNSAPAVIEFNALNIGRTVFRRTRLRDKSAPTQPPGALYAPIFFHVMDGRVFIDAEGTELVDVREAQREALKTAGEMLAGHGEGVPTGTPWNMTVADEAGKTVYSLSFSARKYP